MALADEGALVLKGNHDDMAAHPPPGNTTLASTAWWTRAA
jgi:hypothetical protein